MMLEQWGIHMQKKMSINTDLTLLRNIYLKWLIELNVTYKTLKLLEDNVEKKPVLSMTMTFMENFKGTIH